MDWRGVDALAFSFTRRGWTIRVDGAIRTGEVFRGRKQLVARAWREHAG
jgi:hypothetical protein